MGQIAIASIALPVVFLSLFAGYNRRRSTDELLRQRLARKSEESRARWGAKQIGFAIQTYTQDYDDKWSYEVSRKLLAPYWMTSGKTVDEVPKILDDFVYERPRFRTVKETPPSTEIGYLRTPFGTARIGAGGNVTWR
jgi:hypothetical protein